MVIHIHNYKNSSAHRNDKKERRKKMYNRPARHIAKMYNIYLCINFINLYVYINF